MVLLMQQRIVVVMFILRLFRGTCDDVLVDLLTGTSNTQNLLLGVDTARLDGVEAQMLVR